MMEPIAVLKGADFTQGDGETEPLLGFCEGLLCIEASDGRYGYLALDEDGVERLIARLEQARREWPGRKAQLERYCQGAPETALESVGETFDSLDQRRYALWSQMSAFVGDIWMTLMWVTGVPRYKGDDGSTGSIGSSFYVGNLEKVAGWHLEALERGRPILDRYPMADPWAKDVPPRVWQPCTRLP